MICSKCSRSGYGYDKFEGKPICPSCDCGFTETTNGIRTITPGSASVSTGGRNRLEASEKSVTPKEWSEIAKLCKEVSKR